MHGSGQHWSPPSYVRLGVSVLGADGNDALGDRSSGPDVWPRQVLDQQPRDIQTLFQKLHSGDLVPEAVCRGCKRTTSTN